MWTEIPETASRVRGRIETVLDWAAAHGYRSGENPARWRGHLKRILPERSKVAPVKHFPALPYEDIPEFFSELMNEKGQAAKALQILILTATRTGEIIGSQWSEFDLEHGIWIIPSDRMKAGKEHRVPLVSHCLTLLRVLNDQKSSDFVYPGKKYDVPMSNMAMLALLKRMDRNGLTVHGFRSTFRDWAAEQTSFPREAAEAALAHVISDKTEAAYQRGDMFDKRQKLMTAWADYCLSDSKDNVISIRRFDRKAV
jgi:integrase